MGSYEKGRGTAPRLARLRAAATSLVAWVALVAALCPAASGAEPEKKAPVYRVADASLVYLGNPRLFKKPAVVSADKVYRAIAEYREILEKNLTDKDVRYHFLMKKASDKFTKAVGDVAKAGEYDLVAGVGAVVPGNSETPAVPDVTTATIAKLPT
jgi:hypothetical protein